ncbi:MAG: PKD domain-containing protein [Candidatus Poseidoniia archaeon]|nr:PKD domain-containing protein [Candidatus Poseidoniia archaeon]
MRYLLTFAFLLALSLSLNEDTSAEPEVFMVSVDPPNVDNQEEQTVSFEADCSICNEEELDHFYWRSSIDDVIAEGSDFFDINFEMSSMDLSRGNHEITLQVRDTDGNMSEINDNSTTSLGVTDGHGGGGGSIDVNFDVAPPTLHLGETARFAACTEMQPEPQPCVSDPDPDLSFDWTIQWEGEDEWSYLGDTEAFDYNDFEEGTHNVSLIITDNSNEEVSDPGYLEIMVLPPIPIAVIDAAEQITVKEGQTLEISSHCENNNAEVIDCEHSWEIWEYKDGGDLQFRLTGKDIVLNNLTNEDPNEYEIMLRTNDDLGTLSAWVNVIVTVNPPNEIPSAAITISPQSLGGLTPEYYQYTDLTFSSSSSNDPDGEIVAYKWWFNNDLVSEDANWITSFNETAIYQIKLEVQDDDSVWSTKVSTNFKIVSNSPPSVDFIISSEGLSSTFTSTVSDVEGSVVAFEWFIDDDLISTEANTTWTTNQSGSYAVTLRVMDDGGLWSEVTKSFQVEILQQKNYVATFSSKNIDVGDSFTIDFTGTTGAVAYYEIIVNYPNGSKDTYVAHHTANGYVIDFNRAGTYALDITVFWADGVPQDGLADWYGPTVYVGPEDELVDTNTQPPEVVEPDSSPLPSISVVVSLVTLSLLAVLRRQR